MSRIIAVRSNGILEPKTLTKKLLHRMKHRGSKKIMIYNINGTVLGQIFFPLEKPVDFDKSLAVVASANLYNRNCQGNSLQKALQKLYTSHGEDMVHKLDGSFAFVVADGNKIFAARDPLGLKPLYYVNSEDLLIFASEIKALVRLGLEIKAFPPGYFYSTDKGFVKYHEMPRHIVPDNCISEEEAAKKVKTKLYEAIGMSCDNCDRLGVYLSGGLDSSVIAAAAKELSSDLETFSVGVSSSTDLPKARKVANHIGSTHYEYIYTLEEMLELLPRVIYHLESFDMYLVRSAIANYMLSRMAHEAGIKMVLCGEGSDELFAGYEYLKELKPSEINDELVKLTIAGCSNGFQRVDRMTSAFSIDGRMPFLNSEVRKLAYSIPVKWKIYKKGHQKVEKWILRKAFEGDLPNEILWRKKEKFFQGTGSAKMLSDYAEQYISDYEFLNSRMLHSNFVLRSKEELFYYKIFREFFPENTLLDTIGRTFTVSS